MEKQNFVANIKVILFKHNLQQYMYAIAELYCPYAQLYYYSCTGKQIDLASQK